LIPQGYDSVGVIGSPELLIKSCQPKVGQLEFALVVDPIELKVGPLHLQPRRPDLFICSCFFESSPGVSLFDFATSFLFHLRSQLPMKSIGSTNGGGSGSGLVVVVDSGHDRITPAPIVLLQFRRYAVGAGVATQVHLTVCEFRRWMAMV